jgi:hypothetical protein
MLMGLDLFELTVTPLGCGDLWRTINMGAQLLRRRTRFIRAFGDLGSLTMVLLRSAFVLGVLGTLLTGTLL